MPLSGWTWVVAGAVTVFHLATAQIYGYHRDEPYYLASGRRLAWGYVDNPPLTPFLYRISDTLFGDSQFGLRIIPALLHAVVVMLTVLIARELGADGRAQVVAAVATALTPIALTTGHFLGTVTPELVAWTAASYLVVRLLNGGDPRLCLAVGAVVGLGLLDKWTTGFLVVGLAIGLLLTPQREILWTPWLLAGVAIALLIWAPNLAWQAQHGWPQFDAAKTLQNYGDSRTTPLFLLLILGAGAILAVPGFIWLWRDTTGSHYRALAIALVVIVGLVMVTGGKPYYAAVFGPVLIAAGTVAVAPAGPVLITAIVVVGLWSAPFAMPLLPYSTAKVTSKAGSEIGEYVGWDEYVDDVDEVYRQHPGATIFTGSYSEAGFIELLGGDRAMPQPISGHMTYWYWGHPSGRSDTTIAVGFPPGYLDQWWGHCDVAKVFAAPHGVDNKENGARIWVCTDQKADWDTIWPAIRHS
jgi:4-amino-4-deoxy-L-arabinose transferase-like glycosyltransferase